MDHRPYRVYSGKRGQNLLLLLGAVIVLGSAVAYLVSPFSIRKFAAFPALLGVFLLLLGLAGKLPPRVGTAARRILWALAVVAVGLFAALEVVIVMGDRTDVRAQPDAVVVLGSQVHAWGPSVLLADRLDTAYDYLAEHPELPVIVTGGQGPDEPATEASVMRDYLVGRGLDPSRIWLEEEAHNTSENLSYTKLLLEKLGLKPEESHLLVVSNGFHLARVRMLAERQGLSISTLAAPSSHLAAKIQSYLREAPALVKSWLLDR